MQKHRKISLERVEKFKGKLQLGGKFYEESVPVTVKHWKAPDRVSFKEASTQEFTAVGADEKLTFGPLWATHWLHITFDVPSHWKEQGEIHFVFDFGGEALIWTTSGKPLNALNGQGGEDRRERFRIFPLEEFDLLTSNGFFVECACNELFGNSNWEVGPTAPDPGKTYSLKTCKMALVLPAFWKLYHDYILISEIAKVFIFHYFNIFSLPSNFYKILLFTVTTSQK